MKDSNDISLKEHIKALLIERDKALDAALVSVNDRLKLLNELREGVATTEQLNAVKEIVGALTSRLDKMDGKSTGLGTSWTILLGCIGAVATIVGLLAVIN